MKVDNNREQADRPEGGLEVVNHHTHGILLGAHRQKRHHREVVLTELTKKNRKTSN